MPLISFGEAVQVLQCFLLIVIINELEKLGRRRKL